MDHPINELEGCIFDYLISHKDIPKSLEEIYTDITGLTGHRCSELRAYDATHIYKNRFASICYNINNNYKNIHKYFKNNTCFLLYSEKKNNFIPLSYSNKINNTLKPNTLESNHLVNPLGKNFLDVNPDDFIKYTISHNNSFNYNTLINENETMIELIIRRGNFPNVSFLIENNIVNIGVDYNKLIEFAIKHKQYFMITKIIDLLVEHNNKIYNDKIAIYKQNYNDNFNYTINTTVVENDIFDDLCAFLKYSLYIFFALALIYLFKF